MLSVLNRKQCANTTELFSIFTKIEINNRKLIDEAIPAFRFFFAEFCYYLLVSVLYSNVT